MNHRCYAFLISTLLFLCGAHSYALEIRVVDQHGNPLSGAVIEFSDAMVKATDEIHIIDQVNKRFVPEVLVVPKGANVEFPNSDDIRHHVYSFSKAKPFELRLYKGKPEAPIRFDGAGVVVLGCNIHDAMVGYIYVAEQATTRSDKSGYASLPELDTAASITVWHPLQAGPPDTRKAFNLEDIKATGGAIALTTTEPPKPNTFETRFGNASL